MPTIRIFLARLLGFILILALLPALLRYASPALAHLPGLGGPRIGLIAGHSGYDSGAICGDGLREVDITTRVAAEAADRLRRAGYRVDVLEEFDPRLAGYRAELLLSLHVDSCIGYTGFKVARHHQTATPDQEDRLVGCVQREYGRVTGLPRHDQSITPDMTGYHALKRKHPQTPGAILEMGFLGGDRQRLLAADDSVAAGVVEAVRCFVDRARAVPVPIDAS